MTEHSLAQHSRKCLASQVLPFNGFETGSRDGFKIEVGWTILTLSAKGGNTFQLCEPDFATNPFQRTREDLTCSLSVQAELNDFVLSIGAQPEAISFQDKVVYSSAALQEQRIYLERSVPRPGDSGWYIGVRSEADIDVEASDLSACYAYELLLKRPELIKVLQLPAGYLVVFDGKDIEAVVNPQDKTVFSR